VYARRSTGDEAAFFAQTQSLRELALRKGWGIVLDAQDDGSSGLNTARPGYQTLFAEADQWDTLVVTAFDRLHENQHNFLQMVLDLRKRGKTLVSIAEGIDGTTAFGKVALDAIEKVANLGVGVSTWNPTERPGRRGWLTGVPYGYVAGAQEGHFAVVEAEAAVVRDVYEMRKRGMGLTEIAWELNLRGIPTRAGRRWTATQIMRILKNKTYTGHRRSGRGRWVANRQPAVVAQELYDSAQRGGAA